MRKRVIVQKTDFFAAYSTSVGHNNNTQSVLNFVFLSGLAFGRFGTSRQLCWLELPYPDFAPLTWWQVYLKEISGVKTLSNCCRWVSVTSLGWAEPSYSLKFIQTTTTTKKKIKILTFLSLCINPKKEILLLCTSKLKNWR